MKLAAMIAILIAAAPAARPPDGAAAGPGAKMARALRELRFDRDSCYRVRDLEIVKEDIRIYLNDGHLILSKPVAGKPIAAVFAADVDGGDGEVLLLAPDRAERISLAAHTHSPNLDEHFQSALFVFTGDDARDLQAQIQASPSSRKTPEVGALLDEDWSPVLHSLSGSYRARLVLDLLGGPARHQGLFTGIFAGRTLGNFEVSYDPESQEQILAGGAETRDGRAQFEVWTSFPARSARRNPAARRPDFTVADYRIEASIGEDLGLSAVTRCRIEPAADALAAVAFDISDAENVSSVRVDGREAEVLEREPAPGGDARRGNAVFGKGKPGNSMFVVLPPEPLRAGRSYEFEFHHAGQVIQDAGDRVLYITARGNWYPVHGLNFATYDLRFRYPKDLVLAGPGTVVAEREDDQWRYTELRTGTAIRVAAFNLGNYAHTRETRGGYTVDVYANRSLEASLQPRQTILPLPPLNTRTRIPLGQVGQPVSEVPPDPLGRLKDLAAEVTGALEFMTARFGPPTLPHLAVSPIPGTFGQGFPGLIYLSTLSYLRALPRNRGAPTATQELFFGELLQTHETAHQWWGNRVTTTYYHDAWLMEALANYSALLYIEKTKGPRAEDLLLDSYRADLLAKGEDGKTVESTGPVVMGLRLDTSRQPDAYRAITYGKGTWILHMLRRRMGDQRFLALLAEILRRYDRRAISTDEFRRLAASFLPPKTDDPRLEAFFDNWVYGTGIPALKLSWALKGKAPALRLVGTVTESDAEEDFGAAVPVEIQLGRGRAITQWVRAESDPVTFTVPLAQAPLKVTLDPNHGVLRK
ncbi:MAG: M1 family metallopeptidase [Bryobacteraceae bacterium]